MMRPSILVRILLPLVVLVTSATARADREIGLGLEYDPRMPIGSLRDIVPTAGIMGVHYTWIRGRERMACFKAFLHNNYVGAAIFGICWWLSDSR